MYELLRYYEHVFIHVNQINKGFQLWVGNWGLRHAVSTVFKWKLEAALFWYIHNLVTSCSSYYIWVKGYMCISFFTKNSFCILDEKLYLLTITQYYKQKVRFSYLNTYLPGTISKIDIPVVYSYINMMDPWSQVRFLETVIFGFRN